MDAPQGGCCDAEAIAYIWLKDDNYEKILAITLSFEELKSYLERRMNTPNPNGEYCGVPARPSYSARAGFQTDDAARGRGGESALVVSLWHGMAAVDGFLQQ